MSAQSNALSDNRQMGALRVAAFRCAALRRTKLGRSHAVQTQARAAVTLIELLVVIVILGILMAVALPTFLRQQTKAQDSRTQQYLTTAFKAIRSGTVDTSDQYPSSTSMVSWIQQSEPELTAERGSCTTQVQTAPQDAVLVDPSSTSTALTLCARSQSGNVWKLTASNASAPAFSQATALGEIAAVPVYTWATLPKTAARDSYALVADTLAGVAGGWLFQFRDDKDAAYPWDATAGTANLPPYTWISTPATDSSAGYYNTLGGGWVYTGNIANGGFAGLSFVLPFAGSVQVAGLADGHVQDLAADTFGVGISPNSGTAPTAGNFAEQAVASPSYSGATKFTGGEIDGLAKNSTLYAMLYGSNASHQFRFFEVSVGIRPVKVAGNA